MAATATAAAALQSVEYTRNGEDVSDTCSSMLDVRLGRYMQKYCELWKEDLDRRPEDVKCSGPGQHMSSFCVQFLVGKAGGCKHGQGYIGFYHMP